MGDLQPLAFTRKNDGVVTDDVSGADRAEPNRVAIPSTGPTFAAIKRDFGEIPPQRLGHDLSQAERRTRRCVNLVAVMRFNNLDIDAIAQRLGRRLGQFESKIHARCKV